MRTDWRSGSAVALVGLALLAGCTDPPPEPLRVGSPAPEFSLPALDGATVTGRSFAGRPVVLNFWATWCEPCRKEIPELQELADSSGVEVVGISIDEDGEEAVAPFVAENGIRYRVLLGDLEVFRRFDGFGIPHTVVLDREQRVAGVFRGRVTRDRLAATLERLGAGG